MLTYAGYAGIVVLLAAWAAVRRSRKSPWKIVSWDEFREIVTTQTDHDSTFEALKFKEIQTHQDHVLTFKDYASRMPNHGEPIAPKETPRKARKERALSDTILYLTRVNDVALTNVDFLSSELVRADAALTAAYAEKDQACADLETAQSSATYWQQYSQRLNQDFDALKEEAVRVDKENQGLKATLNRVKEERDLLEADGDCLFREVQSYIAENKKLAAIVDKAVLGDLPNWLKGLKVKNVLCQADHPDAMVEALYNDAPVLESKGNMIRTKYGWADRTMCVFEA